MKREDGEPGCGVREVGDEFEVQGAVPLATNQKESDHSSVAAKEVVEKETKSADSYTAEHEGKLRVSIIYNEDNMRCA